MSEFFSREPVIFHKIICLSLLFQLNKMTNLNLIDRKML